MNNIKIFIKMSEENGILRVSYSGTSITNNCGAISE